MRNNPNKTPTVMKYIDNDYVIQNSPQKLMGGWSLSEDEMSGVLEWNHESGDVTVMATPNWDEDGWVPVGMWMDDEYDPIANSIKLEGTLEEQLEEYLQNMLNILLPISNAILFRSKAMFFNP